MLAVIVREMMAFALESHLRMVIGEVVRGHEYERLKEEQLSAIGKFVSEQDRCLCIPANRVWKIPYLRTSAHSIFA